MDGLAVVGVRKQCSPGLTEVPSCKALLHLIFILQLGNFYRMLGLSVDKKHYLLFHCYIFQVFCQPGLDIWEDCDFFGGYNIFNTER